MKYMQKDPMQKMYKEEYTKKYTKNTQRNVQRISKERKKPDLLSKSDFL